MTASFISFRTSGIRVLGEIEVAPTLLRRPHHAFPYSTSTFLHSARDAPRVVNKNMHEKKEASLDLPVLPAICFLQHREGGCLISQSGVKPPKNRRKWLHIIRCLGDYS
jgi:hypothetical protein